MRPETTGDTENGRSISVIRTLFPGNANLAMVHAAAIPNTRLSGTAIAATSSVSCDRRDGIGLRNRGEVNADTFPQPLDEDEGKRREQEQRQEQQGKADEQVAYEPPVRRGSSGWTWATRQAEMTCGCPVRRARPADGESMPAAR